MRVPQPDIIEHFGNADAVPQPPERCLSRKAGIMRCCLNITTFLPPQKSRVIFFPPPAYPWCRGESYDRILWLFLQSAASHLLYLALRLETGSFPKPLSAKEEQAAFAAMRAGDAAARETLICHNLRLVAHIVKKYYTVSGGQDDFISIGTIGLIKAVDTYDCARTTRFASYASRCIETSCGCNCATPGAKQAPFLCRSRWKPARTAAC